MKLRPLAGTLCIGLFALASTGWAQLKWIPEKERVQAKMVGDFKTADGRKVSLHDLKSKVVFLNFWATWCEFCKEEMPSLTELSRKFSAQALQVIAATNEDPKTVRKFLQGKVFPYPILLDLGDTLIDRFKIKTVPTTIVVDGEGRVAFRVDSVFKWDSPDVIAALDELLNKGKPARTE
jgi:thiol-disulfide isomerase/thioredoxin